MNGSYLILSTDTELEMRGRIHKHCPCMLAGSKGDRFYNFKIVPAPHGLIEILIDALYLYRHDE